MRSLLFTTILLGILGACNFQQTLSPDGLNAFVLNPDNGLKKSIVRDNGICLEMLYRPKDLVLKQEANDDMETWKEAEKRLDSLDYFVLLISRDHQEIESGYAGDPVKFNAAIQYLSQGIKEDISLLASHTFPCEESLYVRSFGASESTGILLVFKSYLARQNGKFSIVFEDSLFGSGRSEFEFDCHDIKDIPRLKH